MKHGRCGDVSTCVQKRLQQKAAGGQSPCANWTSADSRYGSDEVTLLCINTAAGSDAGAVPTTIAVMGSVERAFADASIFPRIAPSANDMTMAEIVIAGASAKRITLP